MRPGRLCLVAALIGVLAVAPAAPSAAARRRVVCASATIRGSQKGDVLIGTNGPDVIRGRGGPDTIYGFGGDDRLCGNRGDDRIVGGDGFDVGRGGRGSDYCQVERPIKCEQGTTVGNRVRR